VQLAVDSTDTVCPIPNDFCGLLLGPSKLSLVGSCSSMAFSVTAVGQVLQCGSCVVGNFIAGSREVFVQGSVVWCGYTCPHQVPELSSADCPLGAFVV
jgi:hypothetical protein